MPTPHVALAVLSGTTGGPATYGIRLAQALAATAAVRLTVLTDRAAPFAGLPEVVELPMRGGLDRLRWQHWALPRQLRRLRPNLYHDTKNALPAAWSGPSVVTVHDLAYHTVPETFGIGSRWFLRLSTRDAVRRAQAIVVPSAATGADLRRFYPGCGDRIHIVPHGIDPWQAVDAGRLAAVRARYGLPPHFVLHVGTVQARKNVDLVIAGVRLLRARGLPHRAVVVGRRGWRAARALAEIQRDDTALWLSHVPDQDLRAIYALADAFVSPSAYEGFGFAVADALASGLPTLVADRSSLPELCGDGAARLSELSAVALADALHPLLADPALRAGLRERGRRRAASFDWATSAEGHLRAYHRALAGDPRAAG